MITRADVVPEVRPIKDESEESADFVTVKTSSLHTIKKNLSIKDIN